MSNKEFKIGDWVIIDDIIFKIDSIVEPNLYSSTMTNAKGLHYEFYGSELELWKPKNKELCVFWDNNCDEYYIGKYGALCFKETFGDEFGNHYKYLQQKGDWDNVAPLKFIQTLKEI